MNRIFKVQQTTFLIFHLRYKNNLMTLCFKKNHKATYNSTNFTRIIPNIDLKTEDFFIDNDDFDSFKKPELKKEIGQPKDENDDLVMISDDEETEFSKSLIKTESDIKIKNNFK